MAAMLRDTQCNYAIGKTRAFWKAYLLLILAFFGGCDYVPPPERVFIAADWPAWMVCDGMALGQGGVVIEDQMITGEDAAGFPFVIPLSRFNVCKIISDDELHPAIRARWKLAQEAAQ